MGWTFTHRNKGVSHREFFTGEWPSTEILDIAQGTPQQVYAAVKAKGGEVFGVVMLIRWVPSEPRFNFGYKDMDEGMGPYAYTCPARILDLLTPTTNERALEWRRKCRETLSTRRKRPRLRAGLLIEFAKPIDFGGGLRRSRLRVVNPKRLLFRDSDGRGQLYRLRRSRLDGAQVVNEGV